MKSMDSLGLVEANEVVLSVGGGGVMMNTAGMCLTRAFKG